MLNREKQRCEASVVGEQGVLGSKENNLETYVNYLVQSITSVAQTLKIIGKSRISQQ